MNTYKKKERFAAQQGKNGNIFVCDWLVKPFLNLTFPLFIKWCYGENEENQSFPVRRNDWLF